MVWVKSVSQYGMVSIAIYEPPDHMVSLELRKVCISVSHGSLKVSSYQNVGLLPF